MLIKRQKASENDPVYSAINKFMNFILQEMITDTVDGKPVPRFLIYDIVKFEVNFFVQIYLPSKWYSTGVLFSRLR